MTVRANDADWARIVELIEDVAGDPTLITSVVNDVRSSIREISGLDASDVARHTRGLLAASTRAIAARRGASAAELSFVEDLAVTRARQGIPAHAVLAGIHVAERRIWARAKEVAEASGVDPALVLDARELYDDWAAAVRERLIVTHRAAGEGAQAQGSDAESLRRLLQGGATGALAAGTAGLGSAVYVVVWPEAEQDSFADLLHLSRPRVVGIGDTDLVGVLRNPPRPREGLTSTIGWAGPGPVEEVPLLRERAALAARAAAQRAITGLIHVADVASVVALHQRSDLAAVLLERHRVALSSLSRTEATLATVRTWLESARDTDLTASRCFVHPNTVRNRVQAVVSATGIDPADTFGAVDLWWLCSEWAAGAGIPG